MINKTNKAILILLIMSILSINSYAQNWKPISSNITFKIKHVAGATAEGSFKGFQGTINFGGQNLTTSYLKGNIETKTFETGSSLRDKTIKGDEYFDVEKYPKITMVSTKIEQGNTPNTFIGTFDLTIKNITKTLKIPFTFTQNGDKGQFQATFKINRIEYGVGKKSFLLNDTPTIFITVNVQK